MRDRCPRCNGPIDCLAGASAHPNNWYCEDERGCGWKAWDKRSLPNVEVSKRILLELKEVAKQLNDLITLVEGTCNSESSTN